MSLATTLLESEMNRREHIQDALYYRRKRMKQSQRAALNLAKCEKLNQAYCLGPCPF